MKKQLSCVLFLVFISLNQALAQVPDTLWTSRYNGPADNDDEGLGCAVDGSGNLYVSGLSYNGLNYDYLTIKYDAATGDTLWIRRYNSPLVADNADIGWGCAVDHSGNLYVIGYSSNGLKFGYLIVKYDAATGDTLWTRRYDEPGSVSEEGHGCAVDDSGNLYVTGSTYFPDSTTDYLTVKYNAVTGAVLWARKYNGPANRRDRADNCAADRSGNLYVSGYSYNGTGYNLLTVKYAFNGDTLWTRRSTEVTDSLGMIFAGCAADSFGNAYVTGMCGYRAGSQNRYCVTIKYDFSGTILWKRIYDNPATVYDASSGCALDRQAKYLYVTGTSYRRPHDHYLTIKYDAVTGDTLWSRTFLSSTGKTEYSISCAVDGSGSLYVTGMSLDTLTWIGDYLTIKYNTGTTTGITGKPAAQAHGAGFRLDRNSPNPLQQSTMINYQLTRPAAVKINICTATGQLVKTIVNTYQQKGSYHVLWEGKDESNRRVTPGVYYYRFQTDESEDTKRAVVLR